jgi:hypothetical protein
MSDFMNELPVADIRIGRTQYLRIYGYADIEPRLVELRINWRDEEQVLRLTTAQAEQIAAGLTKAVTKALK